jgi:hypothetical protein
VVIATHANQDHISGYGKFGDAFSRFHIDEVWLPWTWDPDNRKALKLQQKRLALTEQLEEQMQALAADGRANAKAVNAVENLRGNARAIALLKSGFGVNTKVRYLRAGDQFSANPRSAEDARPPSRGSPSTSSGRRSRKSSYPRWTRPRGRDT